MLKISERHIDSITSENHEMALLASDRLDELWPWVRDHFVQRRRSHRLALVRRALDLTRRGQRQEALEVLAACCCVRSEPRRVELQFDQVWHLRLMAHALTVPVRLGRVFCGRKTIIPAKHAGVQ